MLPGQARAFWAAVLLGVLLGPTLLGLATGGDNPLTAQLAVQSGVLATGLLVCAVLAPSRLRSLTRALGIEAVLGVHRSLGLLVTLLVLVHVVLVLAANPGAVTLFDPRQDTAASRAAVAATGSLVVLIGLAVLKARFRHRYALWRWLHLVLGAAAVAFTALHIWRLRHLVDDPLFRPVLGLLAAGLIGVLGHRWVWRPLFDPRGAHQVLDVRREAPDVHTLTIGPRRPRHGFDTSVLAFEPGQFAWLRLRRSVAAEEHPFTITSCPRQSAAVEFTVRGTGDFSRRLSRLNPGDPIWLDGPHGAFTWDDRTYRRALVLIAAGVGITPMISMLRTLAFRGDNRPVLLISAARTPEELLFVAELAELRARLPLTVVEVLSRPPEGWSGRRGRIDRELLREVLPHGQGRHKIEYFVCGPAAMAAGVLGALSELRVPPAQVHTEQFDLV